MLEIKNMFDNVGCLLAVQDERVGEVETQVAGTQEHAMKAVEELDDGAKKARAARKHQVRCFVLWSKLIILSLPGRDTRANISSRDPRGLCRNRHHHHVDNIEAISCLVSTRQQGQVGERREGQI